MNDTDDEHCADVEEKERAERYRRSKEAFSPKGQDWLAALSALEKINALPSVASLFTARTTVFDHAIEPELERAFAWINEFNRRLTNG